MKPLSQAQRAKLTDDGHRKVAVKAGERRQKKPLALYRVCFTSVSHIRIDLRAASEHEALKAAQKLYVEIDGDDPRFVIYGGEAFGDAFAAKL